MGMRFRFICDACQYEAHVSGQPDHGMIVRTVTMACGGCRNLVDVIVEAEMIGIGEARLRAAVGRCPRCDDRAQLKPWGRESDEGSPSETAGVSPAWGACPRCGGDMRSHGSLGIWD